MLILFALAISSFLLISPPAAINALWPEPQVVNLSCNSCRYVHHNLSFELSVSEASLSTTNCTELYQIISKYKTFIEKQRLPQQSKRNYTNADKSNWTTNKKSCKLPIIQKVIIKVRNCKPISGGNESYEILISERNEPVQLSAPQYNGILYGLETLAQLLDVNEDKPRLCIGSVNDFPKYSHRGLMLDTSRHFLPTEYIIKHLESMSYNKMNVFHLHITDDQSFPLKSDKRPELSDYGSFDRLHAVYSYENLTYIKEKANLLGIRVILELDSPGHTKSWGRRFLTKCQIGQPNTYEALDPSSNATYDVIHDLITEMSEHNFIEPYIHLGFDEVNMTCWKNNSNVQDLMTRLNIRGNYEALERYYLNRISDIVRRASPNSTIILWDEVAEFLDKVPENVIIQFWRGWKKEVLPKLKKLSVPLIISACFYMDGVKYGQDWKDYYDCDLLKPDLNVVGGEACLWAEYIDWTNSLQTAWPRTSAVAERLWSDPLPQDDISDVSKRLDEMRCLLLRRGIPAKPVNPSTQCKPIY